MDGGGTASFEAFVQRCASDLFRTAVLLTHDRGRAEDLLQTALFAVHRRRHRRRRRIDERADPYRHALRGLATTATGRRRPVVQEIVELSDAAAPAEDDVFTAALAALPDRQRAVLVLRHWEDLSPAATARVLGCSVGVVETETDRGLSRLRTAVAGSRGVEELLTENFEDRAGQVPPPPVDLLESTLAAARGARRRRTTVGAAVLVAVLALGGVAVGSELLDRADRRPDLLATPAGQDLGIYEVPTRGSLADDDDFVEGVRSIEWSAPMGWEGAWLEPEEADRRVLFAGEVPSGDRWALVMGRVGFQLLYIWFTGPPGASGATLQSTAPPGRGGSEEPMTLMDQDRPATLVVVGLPGDEVSFSSDGTAWESVPTDDGVAVGTVAAPESLVEAELRITRAGGDVVHRSALSYLHPGGGYVPPGAGPGPSDDPDGRRYGERMHECLLVDGWVVTPAAGGAAILAGAELDPRRASAFQRDRRQCEAELGYRD